MLVRLRSQVTDELHYLFFKRGGNKHRINCRMSACIYLVKHTEALIQHLCNNNCLRSAGHCILITDIDHCGLLVLATEVLHITQELNLKGLRTHIASRGGRSVRASSANNGIGGAHLFFL